MFGRRYFAGSYFAPRYFGDGGEQLSSAAEHGTFTLSGQATVANIGGVSDHGVFTLSGQATVGAFTTTSDHGVFTLSGQATAAAFTTAPDHGVFTLSGQATVGAFAPASDHGIFTLSGQTSTGNITGVADHGVFTLSGQDSNWGITASADYGVFTFTGAVIDATNTGAQTDGGSSKSAIGRKLRKTNYKTGLEPVERPKPVPVVEPEAPTFELPTPEFMEWLSGRMPAEQAPWQEPPIQEPSGFDVLMRLQREMQEAMDEQEITVILQLLD